MTDREQQQLQAKYDKLGEFLSTEVENTGKKGDEFADEMIQWARVMVRGLSLLYSKLYGLDNFGTNELDQKLMATIIEWAEKAHAKVEEEETKPGETILEPRYHPQQMQDLIEAVETRDLDTMIEAVEKLAAFAVTRPKWEVSMITIQVAKCILEPQNFLVSGMLAGAIRRLEDGLEGD